MEIQTEPVLEELRDKPAELSTETQTDPTFDRPITPLFVPKLSGECKATEIAEGDLFDFDMEVEPVLEVLVGKTLQLSLMEVLQEEEMKAINAYREEYLQKRNATLATAQRLEAAEVRRNEERTRRLDQEKARHREEQELAKTLVARTVSKSYMVDLRESIMSSLEAEGFFYDPVKREVESEFIPWLVDKVRDEVSQHQVARSQLDALLISAIGKIKAATAGAEEQRRLYREEQARLAAEAARLVSFAQSWLFPSFV